MPGFCYVEITNMGEGIDHIGIVERIEGNSVFVRIVQQSACAGCHAKGMCSASESKSKIIEIPDTSGHFHVNEEVIVYGKTSMGLQAVFLAFVLPLILVIAVIVLGVQINWGESISALCGLLFLILYYGVLYIFRDKLKKKFIFMLKKLN